jgi:cathepsin L
MFSKIVLALALMAGAANASSPAFVQWMKEHSKAYESEEEHRLRFKVWSNNLELVESHNAEFARGRQTFDLAMNRFADMTNSEYR